MSMECDFSEEDTVYDPMTLQSKKSSSGDSNPSDLSKNTAVVDTEEKELCHPLSRNCKMPVRSLPYSQGPEQLGNR